MLISKEVNGGSTSEKLGIVTICLANLASKRSNSSTKYLLQDAKSNSVLKVSIEMEQIKGDFVNYQM